MKKYLLPTILLLLSNIIIAQNHFKNVYSYLNFNYGAWGACNTINGNYLLLNSGYDTLLMSNHGSLLTKISNTGNVIWTKNYFTNNIFPDFKEVASNQNGDIYLGANFDSLGSYGLIKTDSTGSVLVTKHYFNFRYSKGYHSNNTIKTDGENVYLLGTDSTESDAILIKTDSSGNIIWSKKFKNINNLKMYPESMDIDSYGNIILLCQPNFSTIIKINSQGNTLWSKTISTFDLSDIKINRQFGDYIFISGSSVIALKLDTSGNIIHSFGVGLGLLAYNSCNSAIIGQWNVLLVREYGQVAYKQTDIVILDTACNPVLCKQFGDTLSPPYWGVNATTDHGLLFYGYQILKLDSNFNSGCWDTTVTYSYNSFGITDSSVQLIDSSANITVDSTSIPISISNPQLSKIDLCLLLDLNENQNPYQINVYPNPVVENIHIKSTGNLIEACTISLYNTLGEKIKEWGYSSSFPEITINLSFINNGIYYLLIQSKNTHQFKSFIFQKE